MSLQPKNPKFITNAEMDQMLQEPKPIKQTFTPDQFQQITNQIIRPIQNKINQQLPFKQIPMPKNMQLVLINEQNISFNPSPTDIQHTTTQLIENLNETKGPQKDLNTIVYQTIKDATPFKPNQLKMQYALKITDTQAWLKRSDHSLEYLLKARHTNNLFINLPALKEINVDYIPVVVTSYRDYFFNYLPEIIKQIQNDQPIPIKSHPAFSQLVLFSKDQSDPNSLTYYYSLPINFQMSDDNHFIDNFQNNSLAFKPLLIPSIDVKQTEIDNLNRNTRQLTAKIAVQTPESSTGLTERTVQVIMYDLHDTDLISTSFYATSNYKFPENFTKYQAVLNQRESDYTLRNFVAQKYFNNLTELSNILEKYISFEIEPDLTAKPIINLPDDNYWKSVLANIQPIRLNRYADYFRTIFLKRPELDWQFRSQLTDLIYSYFKLDLNLNIDDDRLMIANKNQQFLYTKSLEVDLNVNFKFYQQLEQAIINEFKQPTPKSEDQIINFDLSDTNKPPLPLTPISKSQHNLSQLFRMLIPSTPDHKLFIINDELINPYGFSNISNLKITKLNQE